MDIIELKERIIQKDLNNFYVFTGTEIGIQKIYLEQMSKVFNMPITRVNSVVEVYSKCTSKSLFGSSCGFYVIRDDTDIMKQEKVYETLSDDIGDNVIVLLYEKIDSRLKFGKYFKDVTVNFEKLSNEVLKRYIKKECPMNENHLAELSNEVSGSYDIALLEVDKIKKYADALGIDYDRSLERLIDLGAIYQPEESNVFEFTDAFMSKQIDKVLHLADVLLSSGVQSINILGTLYNTVKTVLLIQVCQNNDVSSTTGLDNRQVYFNKKYVGKFSSEHLVYLLKLIAGVIDDIKNGLIDDNFSLPYIIVNMK